MKFRIPGWARALVAVCLLFPSVVGAQDAPKAKIPLDYRAYDRWNSIRGTVLSDDGHYVAYALVPEDGDATLIVHDFQTGTDVRESRGIDPAFSADGRFVVFTLRPPNADIHRAQREHKKPDDQPKNGLGVLDLSDGKLATIDRVKNFKLPHDRGQAVLAYVLEAPASPLPSPAGKANANRSIPGPVATGAVPRAMRSVFAVSASPQASMTPVPSARIASEASAAPSPTASPDDLHKKEPGTTLVVRDLRSAHETRFSDVTAYAMSHDGAFVAYAVQSTDGKSDGVRLRQTSDAQTVDVQAAPGHYKNVTFASKQDLLAFVSDAATFRAAAPQYALYQADLRRGPSNAQAHVLVDRSTAGFADAPPSENGELHFSKDGARLMFAVAPVPTPVPSGMPDPMKVDIWNWQDTDLQSSQRKDAETERKRTFAAVTQTDGTHAVRLAGGNVRTLITNENSSMALGIDDVRYRKERSWDSDYDGVYAVSLVDGSRRLLVAKQRDEDGALTSTDPDDNPSLSPDGGFFVAYDAAKRLWFSIETRTGKRVDLTSRLKPAFYDELDDHPAAPPPYGLAGWVDGDGAVLLRDRYDVWAVDPRNGSAHLLTGGLGRTLHVTFAPEKLDADAEFYDSVRPIVLDAVNEETREHGIWQVRVSGATAFKPQPVMMLPKAVSFVAKARFSERRVFFEQTFAEMRNLWSAPSLNAAFTRLSDANPQQADYRWGDEQQIAYRSTWGVPLHGILYTPEHLNRHKKYPMLVYFYERFSDRFHDMPFTTPAPNTSPTLVRYVSNGYVVFVPDVAYRVGHPGESALHCILPAIDAVVKRGFIDESRIGIAGHSWAAYQIAYMLTRTNRFRAAEAGAAVANMTSAYGGIRLESGRVREFQYEKSQSRIGATPWDRTDLYIENSALFHIRNVNTPYLTIANDLDGAVPQLQGIEFFTALRRLGKEAYLFSFDGEDHNLKGREQQKYWTVHLDEFFDHFLLGKPQPDWMTHGVDYLHRGERTIDATSYGEAF